jgi:hypothetical protein
VRFHKRLDSRLFRIPETVDDSGVIVLDERELDDLLEGIDVERDPHKSRRRRGPRTH